MIEPGSDENALTMIKLIDLIKRNVKGERSFWASSLLVRIKRRCSKLMNSRTVSCSENFGMALMKAGACAPGLQCAIQCARQCSVPCSVLQAQLRSINESR